MDKTIWKFPLDIADEQIVVAPQGSKFFSVIEQLGRLTAYAVVRPDAPQDTFTFQVRGTGHPIQEWLPRDYSYLGTAKTGTELISFVWHVFVEKVAYAGGIVDETQRYLSETSSKVC